MDAMAFYILFVVVLFLATSKVISGRASTCDSVCMVGGFCGFCGTGCSSAAMAASLANSGPVRCETVLHGYGTSPLEGGGVVPTCDSAHSG